MSEELESIKTLIEDKIVGMEERQAKDINSVKETQKTIDWRQKRIKGFKEVLERL
ncbi:hypothetical protein LCGC14_1972930 [marine sediment metagenome]|uniref:Uncharacterized protein n=1 Tax=marine sediment metagenome TaxID=412755 RepID=A0A0F9E250_9ZZZZ